MKILKYIVLVVVSAIILYFGISAIIFFSFSKDKKNIEVSGYTYDSQSKEPLPEVLINIQNSTYKAKGSNYTDYSSYLGKEALELETDLNGYFSIILDRSAFLEITFSKDGYRNKTEYNYAKKKIQKEIFLDKE